MNFKSHLRELILSEHSREMAQHIAAEIGDDAKRFKSFIELIYGGEYRVVQRAAWSLGIVAEKYPDLVKPHIHGLILKLSEPAHDALHRNIVRIFQDIDIPKKEYGLLADACFKFLYNNETPIAIRCFSMSVLQKICLDEPDLAHELCTYIEGRIAFESPGFKSRGKKILAYWKKRNADSRHKAIGVRQ